MDGVSDAGGHGLLLPPNPPPPPPQLLLPLPNYANSREITT